MSVVPLDRAKSRAGRVPPHNLDAERAVLGAMLIAPTAVTAVADIITPHDYYSPAHGHIHAAVLELWSDSQPVDVTTVCDRLARQGLIDACGGPVNIHTLQSGVVAASSAPRHARIVADHALLRRLIATAGEIAEIGYGAPEDAAGAVDRAEQLVYELSRRDHPAETVPIADILHGSLERLEQRIVNGRHDGILTGLHHLDDLLGGLGKGVMLIVAARPAVGKTQWGTSLALNIAAEDTPVMFVSAEMSDEQMGDRILSHSSGVDATRIRSGQMLEHDWPRLTKGVSAVGGTPLHLMTKPAPTISDIRVAARRLTAYYRRPPVIVVDYLQLLTGPKAENRNNEVAKLSWSLKTLALDLGTVVVTLSQLSRNVEQRSDKRPMLSDLRDSGAIEQDADVVIGIYRDELYNADCKQPHMAELIVLKNRHGRTGTAAVSYQAATGRFDNAARGI